MNAKTIKLSAVGCVDINNNTMILVCIAHFIKKGTLNQIYVITDVSFCVFLDYFIEIFKCFGSFLTQLIKSI